MRLHLRCACMRLCLRCACVRLCLRCTCVRLCLRCACVRLCLCCACVQLLLLLVQVLWMVLLEGLCSHERLAAWLLACWWHRVSCSSLMDQRIPHLLGQVSKGVA